MTARPTALPLKIEHIPAELQSMDRWVLWKNVQRSKPNGEKVWAKMPLSAKGGAGSSTDAATWVPFGAAFDEYLLGDYDGIGIVLGGTLHGIDLDDCRDPITGGLSDLAQETLDRVEGYAEVSPSGTGIKLFTKTNLDGSRTKTEAGVELYKERRYFTVTGHAINGHASLPLLPQDLGWMIAKVWGESISAGGDDGFANLKFALDGWELDRVIDEVLVHLDPDGGYAEWLKIGAALHHQSGGDPEWLEAWDNWSAASDKWVSGYCAEKWGTFSQQRATGRGAVTLASLLHMTKDKRNANATLTRKNLEMQIESTSDFDQLTKIALKNLYEADLSESDTSLLIKLISKKTKVPVKSLTKDGAKYRRVDATSQQMHLNAAKEVIKLLGREDLLFAQGETWRWSDSGVWEHAEDRQLKQIIHKVAESTKLTLTVINSILDMVKTEVNRDGVIFNQVTDSINCISGELRFDGTWCLHKHSRESYQTTQIPLVYDPSAQAPRFEQFLDEVFAGDADAPQKRLIVEEALGYTLISSCHLEKFFLLIGNGANGKSVLLAVVAALVGPKLVTAVQPSNFDKLFQRGHLMGKLANIVTEIAQGATIADDKLKSLVSGELTTAEMKFKPPFDFKPIATHWFGTNHIPRTRDFSDALFRRAIALSFNNRFEGNHRDVNLTTKLLSELPGIFNLALKGLARLLDKKRFTDCPSSNAIKVEWRLEADQVRQFVDEYCLKKPSKRVAFSVVFNAYKAWADDSGIRQPVSKNTFSSRINGLGFSAHKGTNGERQVVGLELHQKFH